MTFTAALLRNADTALAQANSIPDTDLVMWFPRETNLAIRMLAHIQTILTQGQPERRFILVSERSPTPAYCSPEAIRDLWKSPLLSDKWTHLIRHVAHLREPEYTTTSTGDRFSKRCGASP